MVSFYGVVFLGGLEAFRKDFPTLNGADYLYEKSGRMMGMMEDIFKSNFK